MMKQVFGILLLCVTMALFTDCSDDKIEQEVVVPRQATVTLLVTPNSLGDNGYNDDAAKGVFAFMEESGTPVQLLLPDDREEAESMYQQWLERNASRDSSVLLVGSSAYADLLKRVPPRLTGTGSRVLFFESDEKIEGVSTLMVNRYGTAYLAGAMSRDFDVFLLAASPGFPTLEEAIAGFRSGHSDGRRQVTLHYLAEGEEGFAMPDSAYHTLYRRAEEFYGYNEMIFPLLGGSGMGVLKYVNSDEFTQALLIGMDVNQAGQSTRIPFSVVIRIGEVVKQYLDSWIKGEEWPATKRIGIAEGIADIAITPDFLEHLNVWDERYEDNDTFLNLYKQYVDQAKEKEAAYVQ